MTVNAYLQIGAGTLEQIFFLLIGKETKTIQRKGAKKQRRKV
jgi:hypothetical protein